jgi:trigger factor
MNITVERLPECKARLSAEIPADTVAKTRREIVSAYARQAKVPGFRPGKIPAAVVEKRFADSIEGELKDRLARSAYAEARSQKSLAILGIAQVERDQIDGDGTYRLDVEIVTEPEVELPEYKGLAVEVPKLEVTDESIEGYLENTRKQQAVPVDADRAAAPGDLAVVRYTGSLGGAPLSEQLGQEAGPLAAGEDHWVEIPEEGGESRHFIPGLAAALVGLSAGDTTTFEATFPEEFPVEAVAGKAVSYEVSVTQVKARELPALDDLFAARLGVPGLEELRKQVRAQFEGQRERMRIQIIDNQLLGKLSQDSAFDLPQHIVFNETQRQVNQMVSRGYEQGMTEEDINKSQDDLIRSAEEQARNNVKVMFLLDQIADKEGIRVSDEELSQQVAMMAYREGRPIKKVARELRDRDSFAGLRHDIRISKTIAFLRDQAVVTEVDPPKEGE